MTIHEAVKNLRKATAMSQQSFATELGMSIRAVVNYEKNRAPTAPALARLEGLAAERQLPELERIFGDALATQLGRGRRARPPLDGEEHYLERAFRRSVFENPQSVEAVQIRRLLKPIVAQIRKEDKSSLRILSLDRKSKGARDNQS
jgi:transcriptional regulator with XRE-family HTH domain